MLQPTRTKFRKAHKGRVHGDAVRASSLNYGQYGLKALQPDRVIGKQAEEIVYQFCTIPAPRTQNILDMEDSQLRTDLIMLCDANDAEMGSPQ